MALILEGKKVAAAMNKEIQHDVEVLKEKGINPTLAIIRVGERKDDISYELSAMKRCQAIGISVKNFVLSYDTSRDELLTILDTVNKNSEIHGCLLFRPLPKHIDYETIRQSLSPKKDIDGITDSSLANVFSGTGIGFAPCTPAACMEILDYYKIDVTSKNVVVIGRSMVIGKPITMMLIKRNATVTVCHTKSADMPGICRKADILIVAAGSAKLVGANYIKPGQIIIDVGINIDDSGNLCGDVDFEAAVPIVSSITPVPGGVGAVTNSVLMKHTVEAAKHICLGV